jgi:hypothetical protein
VKSEKDYPIEYRPRPADKEELSGRASFLGIVAGFITLIVSGILLSMVIGVLRLIVALIIAFLVFGTVQSAVAERAYAKYAEERYERIVEKGAEPRG